MIYTPPSYKRVFHACRRMLAKVWLSLIAALQIGITGSQGKTNTTRLIAHLLSSIAPTVVTDMNLDTIYNVPITALKVQPFTKFALFELGVDHPHEMDLHLRIVKPKIGVITGISSVHTDSEHLGSLENLIKEKRKLIESLPQDGYAILNYDDESVRKMAPHTKAKVLWYGTDSTHCDLWVDRASIKVSLEKTSFILFQKQKNKTLKLDVKTNLIGNYHTYTVQAALLTVIAALDLTAMRVSINQLINTIEELKPLSGRMSVENGPLAGTLVLNDALRANPASTASGLETLSEIDYKRGKKIAILAEMGELQYPEEEHKKIGQVLRHLQIDYAIGIGPMQKYTIAEIDPNRGYWAKDVYQAADALKKIIKKGDLIYLKGSLYRHVERVLHILEGKKPPSDLILETYIK